MKNLVLHTDKWDNEFRSNPTMDRFIQHLAEKVAAAAEAAYGSDFAAHQSPGAERARSTVGPDSYESVTKVARDPHKLIAAMDAARHV